MPGNAGYARRRPAGIQTRTRVRSDVGIDCRVCGPPGPVTQPSVPVAPGPVPSGGAVGGLGRDAHWPGVNPMCPPDAAWRGGLAGRSSGWLVHLSGGLAGWRPPGQRGVRAVTSGSSRKRLRRLRPARRERPGPGAGYCPAAWGPGSSARVVLVGGKILRALGFAIAVAGSEMAEDGDAGQ
jgi:hypothetical protein